MEKLNVVSPAGLEAVQTQSAAPRIADLNGQTVGEIWNGVFKGDATFPVIRRLLKQRFPHINLVPYTEFPHVPGNDHPKEQWERARHAASLAKDKGCVAVISGNGA
jgi:hypothetical protein